MSRDDDRLEYKLDQVKEDLHSLDTKVQVLSEKFLMHMEQDTRNLENISHSLEAITDRLSDYNASLVEHIRRSEALEASNELMKEQIELYRHDLGARLDKVEAPHKWVKGTLWVVASTSAILALLKTLSIL